MTLTTDSTSLPSGKAKGAAAAPNVGAPAGRGLRRFAPMLLLLAIGGTYLAYRAYEARRPYEWSGTVEARTISVGSRTGGRVKEVLMREGDPVHAGQPLLVFEAGDLSAQRLMAQGQLEQAQANLEKLERGARPEEIEQARARAITAVAALAESRAGPRSEQIAAARARLVAAEVSSDKAKTDMDRARKLLASGAISQAETDNAEAQLRGAIAQRDALKQSLEELENGARSEELDQARGRATEAKASAVLVEKGARVEDIRAARGLMEAAKGRLDQIDVMVDELTVRAPREATIESLDLRPGDILGPNATAATLVEKDQLYVRIYVPETRVGRVHVGDEVPIYVDSFPDRPFRGTIEHINELGEYSPRNLQTADERANQVFGTRIRIVEGQADMRAGMAAFIKVGQ
jgi:HlyD family secretion protein